MCNETNPSSFYPARDGGNRERLRLPAGEVREVVIRNEDLHEEIGDDQTGNEQRDEERRHHHETSD